MSVRGIQRGLEREVAAAGNARPFNDARARHAALRPFATLVAAVRERGADAGVAHDELLSALVAEYQAHPSAFWSAGLALAMRQPLVALANRIAGSANGDAEARVLAAFFEAASRIEPNPRMSFRLYSETRRRVVRPLAAEYGERRLASTDDVNAVAADDGPEIEDLIDHMRFVRRAIEIAPGPGESLLAYVRRVRRPEHTVERRALHYQRAVRLFELRDHTDAAL